MANPSHTPAERAKKRRGLARTTPVANRAERARQARLRTNVTPGGTAVGPIITPPAQRPTVGPTGPPITPAATTRKTAGRVRRKRKAI